MFSVKSRKQKHHNKRELSMHFSIESQSDSKRFYSVNL